VEQYTNAAWGDFCLVASSTFRVPKALILKSSWGFLTEEGTPGWAAVWITISTPSPIALYTSSVFLISPFILVIF